MAWWSSAGGVRRAGVLGWADCAAQDSRRRPRQMNMADHRGASAGPRQERRRRSGGGRDGHAVNAENGAQFTATTDAQGAYAFGALPVGKYNVSIVVGRPDRLPRAASRSRWTQPHAQHRAERRHRRRRPPKASGRSCWRRIATLEQRITDLESSTVLSEPETRVRRVEVYVDPNGNEHDEPVPGATPAVTYQRERVYRRQTISEKIEEALEDAEKRSVAVGVDAAMATQFAAPDRGRRSRTAARTRWRRPISSSRPGSGAVHGVLRRHRRPERLAARRRDSVADAAERLHRAAGARRTS